MTGYESLAADLTAAGIKSDTEKAYAVAMRAWHGGTLNPTEAQVVAAWEARTAAEEWKPDTARQKG